MKKETILYGLCNGCFGKDSYEDKVIEAEGGDWIVVRDEDGNTAFANFESKKEKKEMISRWLKGEN